MNEPNKIRVLGAIGLPALEDVEPLHRVMRMEGFMPVALERIPGGYPFVEYEKCDVIQVPAAGPFSAILVFEHPHRVFARAVELSRVTTGRVLAFRATGKRPDCLKLYADGRIVMKLGPDDDDETGLLARESEPDEVARAMDAMGVLAPGEDGDPWQVARALGVPDIYRFEQAKALQGARHMVFLSMDSPIV